MATLGRPALALDVDLDSLLYRLRGDDLSRLFIPSLLAFAGRRTVEPWAPPTDRWDDDGGAQHHARQWSDRSGPMPWLSRQQRRYAARQAQKRDR